MNSPLRVLMVEDSEKDAVLLIEDLRRSGYTASFARVDTRDAMEAALDREPWDVVISDYRMPHFSAQEALEVLRAKGVDLPFIVVSGKIGEEAAVAMMRAGAQDYLNKDNMARLTAAIERELREAEIRREHRRATEELRKSEERFKRLAEGVSFIPWEADATTWRFTYVGAQAVEILGYPLSDWYGDGFWPEHIHPEDREWATRFCLETSARSSEFQFDYRMLSADGRVVWIHDVVGVSRDRDGRPSKLYGFMIDVTGRKQAEEELRSSRDQLEAVLRGVTDGITAQDPSGRLVYANEAAARITGFPSARALMQTPREQVLGQFEIMDERGQRFPPEELPGRKALRGERNPEALIRFRKVGADDEHWSIVTATPIFDERGRVRMAVNIFRDITASRRTEEELARLASYPRLNPNPIVETSIAGAVTYLNPAAEKFFPELRDLGERHPLLADLDLAARELERSDGEAFIHAVRVGDAHYQLVVSSVPDSDLMRIYVTDVTERARAEEALRQSEELYRSVVEQAAENIFLVDVDSRRILESNASFQNSLGYSAEEIRALTLYDVVAHDRRSIDQTIRRLVEGKPYRIGERKYRRKDGTLMHVEVRASVIPYDGRRALCVVAHDVTERKRIEDELRRAEEKYRSIFENAVDGIFQTSLEGRLLTANPAMARIFGYGSPEEMMEAVTDVTNLYAEPGRRAELIEVIRKNVTVSDYEIPVYRRDGAVIWVSVNARAVHDTAGSLIGFEGSLEDVTARRQAEEELRESHALLRSVVEGTTDAIFLKDTAGRYLLVNSSCAEVMGRPAEEILGKDDTELYPPEVATPLMEVDRLVAQAGEGITIEEEVPVRGVMRTYLSTKAAYRDHHGNVTGIIGVARDITERKRAEKAIFDIREAERRRIARDLHDVVLHYIVGALQTMQAIQMEGSEAELKQTTEALRRAVRGLRDAVYDLRLERRQPFVQTVESLLELNRQLMPECEFRLNLHGEFEQEPTEVVKTQLTRILQEALTNARRHSYARHIEVSLGMDGDILAEVSDDGRGFTPGESKGGVGLSSMRERAREIGGDLEVESSPGRGTSVKFRAPLRDLRT